MRTRSIIDVFVSFALAGVFLLVISFIAICFLFNNQGEIQKAFISRVSIANSMIISIEECKSSLMLYRRNWDKEHYDDYQSSLASLKQSVQEYLQNERIYPKDNLQTVWHLSNFIEYQESQLDIKNDDYTSLFQSVSYIISGYEAHQRELYLVFQSDMNSGYDEYFQREKINIFKMLILLTIFILSIVIIVLRLAYYQKHIIDFVSSLKDNLGCR